jgi:hypothetical protein
LKLIVLLPCDDPKFDPLIVTDVPTGPDVGETPVMPGGTVNVIPLLAAPLTVTTTGPVVAPEGTGALMIASLQLVGVEAIPLNVTVLDPCEAPKREPLIVTAVPIGPEDGDRLEMFAGRGCGTTKVES